MSLFEYTGDGLGEIAGVGIVFKGRVVDTDDLDLPEGVDLAERDDFKAASGGSVTTQEEMRAVVNRVLTDDGTVLVDGEPDEAASKDATLPPVTPTSPTAVTLPSSTMTTDSSTATTTTTTDTSSQGG